MIYSTGYLHVEGYSSDAQEMSRFQQPRTGANIIMSPDV